MSAIARILCGSRFSNLVLEPSLHEPGSSTNFGFDSSSPLASRSTGRRAPPPRAKRDPSLRGTMAIEDGAVARLLPADCLSIQEVGATGMRPRSALSLAPQPDRCLVGRRGCEDARACRRGGRAKRAVRRVPPGRSGVGELASCQRRWSCPHADSARRPCPAGSCDLGLSAASPACACDRVPPWQRHTAHSAPPVLR